MRVQALLQAFKKEAFQKKNLVYFMLAGVAVGIALGAALYGLHLSKRVVEIIGALVPPGPSSQWPSPGRTGHRASSQHRQACCTLRWLPLLTPQALLRRLCAGKVLLPGVAASVSA